MDAIFWTFFLNFVFNFDFVILNDEKGVKMHQVNGWIENDHLGDLVLWCTILFYIDFCLTFQKELLMQETNF